MIEMLKLDSSSGKKLLRLPVFRFPLTSAHEGHSLEQNPHRQTASRENLYY
jgi:hypothetical protein